MGLKVYPVGIAVGLVAITTIGLMLITNVFPVGDVSIVYLIPVLICATRWGLFPALVAAALGVAASDFFFILPLYTFTIDSPSDVVDLILFACVAVVTSDLAARLRQEVWKSRQREEEVGDLYRFSRRLIGAGTPTEIYGLIEDHISTTLRTRAFVIGASHEKNPDLRELGQVDLPPRIRDEANEMLHAGCHPQAKMIADAEGGHLWMLKAVSPSTVDLGIIAIDLGSRSLQAAGPIERNVGELLADAMATLERLDVGRLISEANMRAEADALRDALIGSVSHELRTPLASILGAATVLSQADTVRGESRLAQLANLIRDEAEQLDNGIQNLLDAARITTDSVRLKVEWVDPVDIVNEAIARKQRLLADHLVEVALARDMPMIRVDSTLVGQALGQFIENAAKYSPSGSTIRISTRVEQGRVAILVTDEGSGLDESERGRIWLRSYRAARLASTVAGTGLGLWIAHAFVKANGGELTASSEGPGRGTTVSMSFPVPDDAVNELAREDDE